MTKNKKRKWLWLTIPVLLLVCGVITAYLLFHYFNSAPTDLLNEETTFSIKQGESLGTISRRLEDEGYIRSADFLRYYSRYKKTSTSFRAGTFPLIKGVDAMTIHDLLVYGDEIKATLVIPEGWTLRRIAQELDSKGITQQEDFLAAAYNPQLLEEYNIYGDSFEGYLFPDTYQFPVEYPADKIIRALADNFFRKIGELNPDYQEIPPKELHRMITIASIVEKEYRVKEEAPLIASVFYNRLRINIHLQSCATIMYIITDELGNPHPGRLYNKDLEIESEYNTYLHLGLPPGPISNPGKTSLQAALFPADTNYYFFVVNDLDAGTHTFTTYLDEHIQAKYEYNKLLRVR